MAFTDLPRNWSMLPLTDPDLLDDVLDLMVGLQDRVAGGLVVLVCDAEVRLLQPCVIGPGPGPYDPLVVRNLVSIVVEAFAHVAAGTLIVGLARRGALTPTVDDLAWIAAIRDELAATSWTLSSAHVITLEGSRPVAA